MGDRFANFVSQKINKIRWRPAFDQVVQDSCEFVSGSWDNDINKLCLWKIEDRTNIVENENSGECATIEIEPVLQFEQKHEGDVTDLTYIPNDLILVASSNGTVMLYKQESNLQALHLMNEWRGLHCYEQQQFGCPCTSLAPNTAESFASVGEDGKLCVMNIEETQPLRVFEKADSCTLNAACFLKHNEVAAVNSIGQLKVWDIREPDDEPSRMFLPSGDMTSLQCLDKHPTQPHIVCTGGQDGALTIWDMRHDRFPVTVLQAHSAHMWEVKFHPTHPDNLFSCSNDGSLWHWDATSIGTGHGKDMNFAPSSLNNTTASGFMGKKSDNASNYTSPWLASDASKHRMEITDLLTGNTMPVNTLDILGNRLICGTDAEQIYTLTNLVIR